MQDEPLDSEAPHRAFEDMAAEVNRLAAAAGSSTPSVIKTADDVSVPVAFPLSLPSTILSSHALSTVFDIATLTTLNRRVVRLLGASE